MKKRGQFYLLSAIIIIGGIIGFSAVSNHFSKTDYEDLTGASEELDTEGAKVLEFKVFNPGEGFGQDIIPEELEVGNPIRTRYEDLYEIFKNQGLEEEKIKDEIADVMLMDDFTRLYNIHQGEGKEIFFIFGRPIYRSFRDIWEMDVQAFKYLDCIETGGVELNLAGSSTEQELCLENNDIRLNLKGRETAPNATVVQLGDVGENQKVVLTINEEIEPMEFEIKPGENFYFVISKQIGEEFYLTRSG